MSAKQITLDFETYYDEDYSLSKMTTEEYLRDPRFEVIGVSIMMGDSRPVFLDPDQFAQWLARGGKQTLEAAAVCAHNAAFDMGILGWIYDVHPRVILDTLSMARGVFGIEQPCSLAALATYFALPPKGKEVVRAKGKTRRMFTPAEYKAYGDYCSHDTWLCRQIFLRLAPQVPISEIYTISWTIRNFTKPVIEVDTQLIASALDQHRTSMVALRMAVNADLTAIRSDEQFADLLKAYGVEPPVKVSKTTGEVTWAFAKGDLAFTDLLDHEDPAVVALVEARLGNKSSILESRMERFLGIGRRGRLPVPLRYAGAAATKRWSGEDKINLQNLSKGSPLRYGLRAPEGYYWVAPDLSQIELRVNGWQTGEMQIIDNLVNGGDNYAAMASDIYGFEITKAMGKTTHVNERFVGKTAVLGCGYGCGAERFQTMLKVDSRKWGFHLPDTSLDFADRVVRAYRAKYPRIRSFWKAAAEAIPLLATGGSGQLGPYHIDAGRLFLPNGQYLYYPHLRQVAGGRFGTEWVYTRTRGRGYKHERLYGAKLVENVTQAVSRLPMCEAIPRIEQRFRCFGTVHDELWTLVPNSVPPEDAVPWIIKQMTVTPTWAPGLVLDAEAHHGPTYGDCK